MFELTNIFQRWLRLGVALAALTPVSAALAQAPKKVTIAVGSGFIDVGYPTETLPLYLGYWKSEGYDVELVPAGGSLQAIQQMVGGNADFAEVNATPVIQANADHGMPVRIVLTNAVINWSLAVPQASPIKEPKDFRGKTIGVFNLATGNLALLYSYLGKAGLERSDYNLVPLGVGAPVIEALKSNKVDAVFYWGSAIAAYGNVLDLRRFAGDDWKTYPDYSLTVMQKTIDRDPAMVVAIARGMAKATTFALENPDCARRVYYANNKMTSAPGMTEELQAKRDMAVINEQLAANKNAIVLGGGRLVGASDLKAYDGLQRFLADSGQIKKVVPSKDVIASIPDLAAKANDFDSAAIKKAASECKL